MTEALIFAAAAVVLGGLLGRASWCAVVMYAFLLASIAGTGLSALGQPKPVWLGCGLTKESTVLGYSLDEGHAIYLWLQSDNGPLSCELPWNEKQAAQINDAAGQAKSQGVPLKIKIQGTPGTPGEPGTKDDEKPMAYPAPQAPLPPKQGE